MIDYHTYCRLHDLHQQQGLNLTQIAQALQLSRDTVSKWLHTERYRAPITPARSSKLDPYKAQIRAWLDRERKDAGSTVRIDQSFPCAC